MHYQTSSFPHVLPCGFALVNHKFKSLNFRWVFCFDYFLFFSVLAEQEQLKKKGFMSNRASSEHIMAISSQGPINVNRALPMDPAGVLVAL